MPNKLENLHRNLVADGYELGSFDDFKNAMTDSTKAANLYKNLSADGYELGSQEEFFNNVGNTSMKPKPVQTSASTPRTEPSGPGVLSRTYQAARGKLDEAMKVAEGYKAQLEKQNAQANTPATEQGGGYQPTWQEMEAFGSKLGGADYAAKNATKGVEQMGKNIGKASTFGSGNVGLGNNQNLRKGKQTFDAEKGAFVDTYVTSDGREFKDIQQANNVQSDLDMIGSNVRYKEAMKSLGIDVEALGKTDVNQQLKDANAELENLEVEIDKHRLGQAARLARGMGLAGGHANGTSKEDTDLDNLLAAKRLLERRINALEANRDNAGLWRGTGDVFFDDSSLSFGLTDLGDAKAMQRINEKIEAANGGTPNLTIGEKALVRNYMLNQEAQQLNNDNWWYNAGQGVGHTLSFMKDFALTGGGFAGLAKGGMALGAKGGTKLATKMLGDYATKNLGTKALGKTIQYIGKGTGLAIGAEAGGFALNNTVQAASSLADITNKQLGNLTIGKDGNLTFEGGKSLGEAVLSSQLSRIGENASELVGVGFDALPGILGRVIQRTTAGKVLKRITDSKFWKSGEKALDYLGVQSLWGEGMEEEYNMLRDVVIGESGWFKDPNDPSKPAFFDGEQQLNTWLTVGLTSVILRLPSMVTSGTQAANYYGMKYNLNTSDRNMRDVFGDASRYESVKAMIDGADNQQLAGVLNGLMNRAELSRDEKEAMFLYANDLVKLRGFNIGNVVAAANGFREQPKPTGYNIRGLHVDEVDKDGNVLASHDYDTAEDLKAGLYELQQRRSDDRLKSDTGIMKSRPNGQYDDMLSQYCLDAGIEQSDFEAILEKPSMERTDAEQQLVAPFADLLHEAAYDNTMLHEEESQQDGEDIADTDAIDIETPSEDGAALYAQWKAAQQARDELFARNEDLAQEVLSREESGLSHQEIISSLTTFRPDDVQGVIDYYNSKAKYEGYMNRMEAKIDEEAKNSRERHSFRGTIDGKADLTGVHQITDGENVYYLVSGNITTDGNGRITDSDSGLIIGMDENGDFVNIGDTSGYSVMPVSMTLDQFEESERIRLQKSVSEAIAGTEEAATGDVASTPLTEPGAAVEAGTGAAAETEAANTPLTEPETETGGEEPVVEGTAVSRIPKDEGGNLLYEQASPEDAYDALVEQVGEAGAKVLAQKQLDKAKKEHTKLTKQLDKGDVGGNTLQEQIAEMKNLQDAIAAEQGRMDFWTKVLAVPNNRLLNNTNTPPTGGTGTNTPPANNPPTPPTDEVPEYRYDTPQAARERGYKIVEGQRIDRQEEKPMPQGMEVEVQYSTKDKVKGRLTVSELDDVQGSHLTNGQVNDKHFIPEAQPKSEFGVDRQAAAQTNASETNFRPELTLTFNGTQSAYSGSAPQTNRRGEVIQGNGRRNLIEFVYAPGNEAAAKRYKEYLKAHAAELGTTAEEIEKMEKPVAHIVLDVADEEAIRLGQFTATDLETGGKVIPNVQSTVTKLGDKYTSFTNILLRSDDPDASLAERVDANMESAVNWLNQGGYISNTEAKSLLEDKEAARQFMKDMLTDIIFKDANPDLRTMFYELPKNIQSALVSVIGRELTTSPESSILKDVQESIQAFHELMVSSPEFASASGNFEKRKKAVDAAVNDWLRQINLDGSLNKGKFSNFALELAKLYKSLTDQKTLATRLRDYYDLVNGSTRQLGMFDEPGSGEVMTKEQAIKQIFGIEYGRERTVPVASNVQGSTEGGEGGTDNNPTGERGPSEGGPAETGGGNTGHAPEGGEVSEREKFIAEHPLTVAEIDAASASPAQKILAKQYLNLNDEHVSEMAKAAYLYIYNKKVAASTPLTEPEAETGTTAAAPAAETAPAGTETKPKTGTQAGTTGTETKPTGTQGGTQNAAQAAAKAKMAAALAKLKKHGKKSDNQTDAYSVENLTPEQIEDMFEVVEAGAELGYTLLDGVETKDEWIAQMRDAIAEPLKDATGYNDTEVDELLNDMWNYPYAVGEEVKNVGEWAAEKGINVNDTENGTEEEEGNGDTGVVGGLEPGVDNTPEGGVEERPVVSGTAEGGTERPANSGTAGQGEVPTGRGRGNGGTRGGRNPKPGKPSMGPGLFDSPEDTGDVESGENGTNDAGDTGRGLGNNESGGSRAETGEAGNGRQSVQRGVGENKPLADISKEKSPYQPASTSEKKFAIGSVIPSGIADSIANAFKRLKEKFFKKKTVLDFVREELGYKTNEEMMSTSDGSKGTGLSAEQVDAVALAIGKMKEGKSFIVGDMTGVGKGRTAAALIRWGKQHGKKVLFVTAKPALYSSMYGDLQDIGTEYMPFCLNGGDPESNITDGDGNIIYKHPNASAQNALWKQDSDELPRNKKGRQYDFIMTTYDQVSSANSASARLKLEWLKRYAKDAIVIMDESHNASGNSNRGNFFRDVVDVASGVTFLSATYAKRPENMLLYAVKSSMNAVNMPVSAFLQAIKEYGVSMQELMASALFGSGEMIRRERDMSDVKIEWTDPKEIYSEEEYEQCRKTSDKTMSLVNDIIDFQRTYVYPLVREKQEEYDLQNRAAALTGGPQVKVNSMPYKGQVSNIVRLMTYTMKAKKAAQMAIEQIKQGKRPVITVDNTLEAYTKDLGEEIDDLGFKPVLDRGVKFALKYTITQFTYDENGNKQILLQQAFDAEDELSDAGQRALENLRQRIEEYMDDKDKIDLTLSPIDLVRHMLADAGYSCGEITGRSYQLERKEGGGYRKVPYTAKKKEVARRFNGGTKKHALPKEEQYQAIILNRSGGTGVNLHSSKTFGNQDQRTMIILQPAQDVNDEVQIRGRVDRTGQEHRAEYYYVTSPIPAEQKLTMMLKQKLASLDAQSVGTKDVSSNKVDSQDMDNKYGNAVCYEYLLEHLQDVNAFLENGQLQLKKGEWVAPSNLLYKVLQDIQRLPCELQEKVITELSQRYADHIDYLNQNGVNDLESTTKNLEAVTIDKATFIKGKDNESINEFAHDTTIERVEVNVLKKPMRSSDIKKKMKDLDALDEDGIPKEGVLGQTTDKVQEVMKQKVADRQARYDEQEAKLEEKIRKEHPQKEDQSDEDYEALIKTWPSLQEMHNRHAADIAQYQADLQSQYNDVYRAAMYLKPGRPYLVPLTDDVSSDAALMYGRFLGFQMKNGDPRQVQAVFAVKDSRAMITIPLVNQKKVIEKIINERNDMEIVALGRDPDTYDDLHMEQRAKNWDEWWDKMIPKNTNRQVRFMITGNVLQACGSLGKYKGQIVTFTRKNKETGEITLERGMLLAENFDPENFRVRRAVEKKDVWDAYDEVKDDRSNISCHREGDHMTVKFEKRKGEKLVDHPVQKDDEMKALAMNNEIRPSGKSTLLCVIKEENVEKVLEHLYKEYGYTKEELFVMPDSTEKPDAIVRTNRPYQEVIDEFSPKYGSNKYSVENKIRQMLKRYKMDVNNEGLKNDIREAVQLRQAYLRREVADQESNRLAWEVLIEDQYIERYKEDKDMREHHMRKREAILEELEYRGFKGKAYHFEQGKISLDDVRKMFKEMNDPSTEEGKAKARLFEKVMEKVSKLPMEIFMNEKLDNDTGGWAGGRIINYNWKYMNADYIADQAKADTILHELIHTVTAYADYCVEKGLDHLLDQQMIDAINELHAIFNVIENDPTFVHDGVKAYGLTNVREMLSEAGSNSLFRADLKKTNLWQKMWSGILKFFGIKQNVAGARQVNAFDVVMERLDYLVENFKQEAWDTFYQGTQFGGYGYKKQDAQKIDSADPMEAIEQAAESWEKSQGENGHLSVEEARQKIEELSKKYKPVVPIAVGTSNPTTDREVIEMFFGKRIADFFIASKPASEVKAVAKNLKAAISEKMGGGFTDIFQKIIIFADKLKAKHYEEAFFHENIHALLDKRYGSRDDKGVYPRRSIADVFWDKAPEWVNGTSKEKIKEYYKDSEDSWQEEFFTYCLSRCMVSGRLDLMKEHFDNPEDIKYIDEILNAIGYDERREAKERGGRVAKSAERRGDNNTGQLRQGLSLEQIRERISELKKRKDELFKENGIDFATTKLSKIFKFRRENKQINELELELSKLYQLEGKLDMRGFIEDPLEAIRRAAKSWRREKRAADSQAEGSHEYSAKKVYHDRLDSVGYVATESFQDQMLSVKTGQNAIAKDKEIPDSQNAYMAENLMHGKTKNEMDEFNTNYRDPLIEKINDILDKTGMNYGDIDRYVYAKSGLERNRALYVRDWLELQRRKVIRNYEDLNPEEQAIYERMENRIVTDFEDGNISEEERDKRLAKAVNEAHLQYIDELADEWRMLMSDKILDLWDGNITFPQYLDALSGFIRKYVDNDYKPEEHDYSGFRSMYGDENQEYDESEIIGEVMDAEERMGFEEDEDSGEYAGHGTDDSGYKTADLLWTLIRSVNRYGLERYREAGMRSDEEIDHVERMFNFYVPMRGFKDDTGEDIYQYMTNPDENGVRRIGGLLKHAKGRKSEAELPIATMFANNYKAIADCNRNLVNQKFYRLCQANPNDLIVLSDVWAVLQKSPTGEEVWVESMPEIPANASEEDIRQITLDWEDDMKALAKEGKARKIKGKIHYDYKPRDKKKQEEHIVEVRINGQRKFMMVVGNPRLAQALNGQLRFKGELGKVSKYYGILKNFMASTFTSWSPTFAMRNMLRDWTHFRMMLSVREGETYAHAAAKYYKETMPRPYHGKYANGKDKIGMVELFALYRADALDMENEVERDFKDFMDNGGVTGYVFMQKLEDIQKTIDKSLKQLQQDRSKGGGLQTVIRLNSKMIDGLLDTIEAYNEAVENNARFATYRASRHVAGRTKARSAYDAKEITVNFNRKGAGLNTAGFKSSNKEVMLAAQMAGLTSQVLGEGRVFFNATVQAIATTFKMFRNPDGSLNKGYIAKWTARYASIPFAIGFLAPYINHILAAMLSGGGDDDDKWYERGLKASTGRYTLKDDPYANLPEWTRRNNICLYVGGDNFITIPVGQELAAFLALGDIAAGGIYDSDLKPVDNTIADEVMSVLNTFSPVEIEQKVTKGGLFSKDWKDEVLGKTFSVLTPIISVQHNRSWAGRPIFREDKNEKDAWVPEYQKAYSSTNPVLMWASKGLHELGGGDEKKRGVGITEWNPGMVQYLCEQYTGGPGKTLAGAISTGRDLIETMKSEGNPEFNIRKIEGVKAFVQQGDERTAFYRTKAKYQKYEREANRYIYENNIVELEKQAKKKDPMAMLELEKLSKDADFVRAQIVREANHQDKRKGKIGLDDFRRDMYKMSGKERKEAEAQYNRMVADMVEKLDAVGKEK